MRAAETAFAPPETHWTQLVPGRHDCAYFDVSRNGCLTTLDRPPQYTIDFEGAIGSASLHIVLTPATIRSAAWENHLSSSTCRVPCCAPHSWPKRGWPCSRR